MILLKGSELASRIRANIANDIEGLRQQGVPAPRVAIILSTSDPAADVYIESVERSFRKVGIDVERVAVDAIATNDDLATRIQRLGGDDSFQGILLPTPLRPGLSLAAAQDALPPEKDIEGMSTVNAGRLALGRPHFVPATPLGGMELLRHYGIQVDRKRAVVVGRSSVVGWPMAVLLNQAGATVTVCHSHTRDLGAVTREGELLVSATGKPKLITRDMIRPGAVVVDFGVNITDAGMCGDVDFDGAAEVASAITPVPGGTGPVTTAVLIRNVLEAAKRQWNLGDKSEPIAAVQSANKGCVQ